MTGDELREKVVMVHPELYDDPAAQNGEIGYITAADPGEDLYRVRFDDERRALYSSNALLVFQSSDQIYAKIKEDVMLLRPVDFKDLKNIALMLDYGTPERLRNAMEIAKKNPGVIEMALTSLEESLGLNQGYKRGR